MKVLFVGLGSIGTRHLKNLRAYCQKEGLPLQVAALRSSSRTISAEVAALVDEQLSQLPAESTYDVAFITNPTHLHAQAISVLKGRVGTFFIEKPIFEDPHYALETVGLTQGQKAYVAAPMRFTALYAAVKEKLEKGQIVPFCARAICSSYLPDWRKGVDYRTIYSAQKEMGGGVTLDLIHEWDYLADLFGMPQKAYMLRGQFSALEINSDDLSVYVARWPALLGEVHLDYFGRGYRRTLELMAESGSFVADFGTGVLTLPDGSEERYEEEANRRYEREMAYFMQYALQGEGESINSPQKALQVLQLVLQGCG